MTRFAFMASMAFIALVCFMAWIAFMAFIALICFMAWFAFIAIMALMALICVMAWFAFIASIAFIWSMRKIAWLFLRGSHRRAKAKHPPLAHGEEFPAEISGGISLWNPQSAELRS